MEKRVQNMVNVTTQLYISPILLQEELEYDTQKSVDNMQVLNLILEFLIF
jgi:hypothetical protein